MSDEARLKQLTELARRVWPQHPRLTIGRRPDVGAVAVESDRDADESFTLLLIEDVGSIDKALDALEAALRVLAGETPAWVEQLASEWEKQAEQSFEDGYRECVEQLRQCAAELSERAKGKP